MGSTTAISGGDATRQMRVCHLCSTTLDSHYFANLGKGLAAHGVSLLLCSFSERQPPEWIRDAPGTDYFCLNAPSRRSYPLAVVRLARLLRRERADILQTHLFDAGAVGVLAARLARVPVTVLTRHHTDEAWLIGHRLNVALDRWMARSADHVVGFSHAVRNHMMSREQIDGGKIEVIYQGFDFDELAATEEDRGRVRAEFGLESAFVIGCVARFFKTKGHAYLLAAVRDLVQEIPNLRLLLLGSGDSAVIGKLVDEYGLRENVIFGGYRRDVSACIRAMDIVVHPSLTEAFCQAIIETMAAGTALVSTNVAGAPEVVTHGETGMLIPPADSSAIVRAVLDLYRNPEKRIGMALAGQESVRRRFTIERMVDRQIDCYKRSLASRFGGGAAYVRSQV